MRTGLAAKAASFLNRYRKDKKSRINTTDEEAGALLRRAVLDGIPFMAGRIGWLEGYATGMWRGGGEPSKDFLQKLHRHAGIFPATAENLAIFGCSHYEALSSADLLGIMQSPFEGWLVSHSCPKARRAYLHALEPYLSPDPWSAALAGKRVLVVHPFGKSIASQYRENGHRLFCDPRVLPKFELEVLKPPQTMCAGTDGFLSWADGLEHTKRKIQERSFDVAIVGCGAYGLSVAAFIKNIMGKPVVHLGGATQILFGVSGERWKRRPEHASLMNGFWKQPLEAERPEGWRAIEDGCYW